MTAKTAQHTPGPWQLYGAKLRKQFPTPILEIQDAGGKPVVAWPGFDGIDRPKPETEANARLIAAAPDLLEACKMLLDRTANPITDHTFYTLTDARNAAHAAIAKATDGR